MIPFPSLVFGEICSILQTCTEANFDSVFLQLRKFVEYGSDGCILLLQACLSQLHRNEKDIQNVQQKPDVVSAIFKFLLNRPNFSTVLCEALDAALARDGFLENLSNALNLSLPEKIGVGLALSESENPEIKNRGKNFCITQIQDLFASLSSELSTLQIQDIVIFLYRSEGLLKYVDSFTNMLSLLKPKESTLLTLAPILPSDVPGFNSLRKLDSFFQSSENDFDALLEEIEREMSMADIVNELGYGCTANTSRCKQILSFFLPLNETKIAKLLGAIARNHVNREDIQNLSSTFFSVFTDSSTNDSSWPNSWNADVLVDSIKQLAPNMNWSTVIKNLDHEGFYVPDETAVSILMSVYHKACEDPFPLHAICGSIWKNTEGQLSFLRNIATAPPNVFTFAHSPRQLTSLESLHLTNLTTERGNKAWFCLDFLEVLCQLAEMGHTGTVRSILDYPLKHCPEVLLLGLSQINTAYNLVQHEVSSIVFPKLFKDPAKLSIIDRLCNLNLNLVLREFLNLHGSDPNSISRILEICQELKILSLVLDNAPFSFCIKFAALASEKDLLNLEKWLNDYLSTYEDVFLKSCIAFLKENYPNANVSTDNSFEQLRARLNINQDTYATVVKVLQAQSSQLLPDQIVEEVKRMNARSNLEDQGSVAAESVVIEGNSKDVEAEANTYIDTKEVEAEANAYFHQMFSEQLKVNEMVQMLVRFKESSERREKLIFECIIANVFEEYKFFPQYPDKQLKLAAILFGSIIKHQLITHITLGMALRTVLDALRKSVDSKMFLFGVVALEQFQDRLVEWPQYCNHLLQIAHLRSSNPSLVSVIEQALARRNSSTSSESNGIANATTDLQRGPQMSAESIEVSDSSWQLVNPNVMPSGLQLSQVQSQRNQGIFDDRIKSTGTSVSHLKHLNNIGQSSFVSTAIDSASNQKAIPVQSLQFQSSQHSADGSASVSSSPSLLRSSRTPTGVLRQPSYSTGFGAALNIETLVAAAEKRDTHIEAPTNDVQDKVLFIINNISNDNLESKAKEFMEVVKEEFYPWFAQYMVMKRASIEPNFHDLYLKFLEKVNSKSLNKEIVKATYENCKVLLRSNLIKSSSAERSLLKNLGSWLGKFTIGRNQVLLAKEIDPKALIIEAYEKGLMIAVIPFTSKVLEPCQSSLAYHPPNPWTMAILSLLVEIYNLPNLKMNLKFDIEVLFKNLGVDMKDVKPTSLLKDRVRAVEGNPDFSTKDISSSQPAVAPDLNAALVPNLGHVEDASSTTYQSGHPSLLSQYSAPVHLSTSTMVDEEKAGNLIMNERIGSVQALAQSAQPPSPFSVEQLTPLLTNYETYINVNPKLAATGFPFHRYILLAMDKAVKDILSPVIQRSVTIATKTTKELVLKDFSVESDGSVVSSAARMMVCKLAGSLAHVTCKELLRGALSNNLRSILQSSYVGVDIDQIVQTITTDNLDLGCAVIENVATAKAMEMIDGELGPSFAQRKQRETAGPGFLDASTYSQVPNARFPESLRLKPGRLTFTQQQVYRDFVRNTSPNQSGQGSSAARNSAISVGTGSANSPPSGSGQLNSSLHSISQVGPGFNPIGQPLDLGPEESDRSSPLHSLSSQVGPDEGYNQRPEVNSVVTAFQANTAVDMHAQDASSISKEMGSAVPSSPTPSSEPLVAIQPDSLLTTREALDKYQIFAQKLASMLAKDARDVEIQGVVSEISDIILKCVTRDEAALAVAQKVFKSLYGSTSSTHIAYHLQVLAAIRDVCKLVVKELTSWVIYSDEERKFNKEVTIGLIRCELLNLAEYNVHLSKLIDGGRNKAAMDFAISLVQELVAQEPGGSLSEFYNLIDALEKLSTRPGSPESLSQLLETIRNTSANANSLSAVNSNKEEKGRLSREKKVTTGSRSFTSREDNNIFDSAAAEPPGIREQVSLLYDEWCCICDLPTTADEAYTHYVSQLHQSGWLKGDDITEHFFRILTEVSVSNCIVREQSSLSLQLQGTQQPQQLSFVSIDSYAKLVVLILKNCPVDQESSKAVPLLSKILSVTAKVLIKDAEEKKTFFNPRPYFRLFANWLLDLTSLDTVLDGSNFQVLIAFANMFHVLQPLRVPGWSFAWLELVSHRCFMPKLLMLSSPKGWPFFQRLLVDLFKFMEPYLRNAELGESVRFLYKGTLRVLLVLLHDFPEFLCEYHFSFCDVIPPSCIQMRNVILSAFPQNMRLPDPSTPNLKIDLLAEISQPPHILSDVEAALRAKQIKADIDEYLKTKPEGSLFLAELRQKLLLSQSEASQAGTRYNVPLINSLVLYVGMQAINKLQSKSASGQQLGQEDSAAMDIFQSLIRNLDTEGRYLFLNAVANQLRYPNNHTHYFSFVLLYLFAESNQDTIQEQITRVLLERLIVNRPHPWGLLITFIELFKNPRYNFWNRSFTRCAPEIEKLFESVSRSCGGPRAVDDIVPGGNLDGGH